MYPPEVFAAASAETWSAGAAPRPRSGRREVVIGGRRVKTIDIHARCIIPEAQALLGIPLRDARFGRGIDEVGTQRLQVMDEQGIDVEALGDDEFADPKFHPFWAKGEELGVLVSLHPQGTPDLARPLGGNGWLANTIGNPLDTTIALSHLIFEGTSDRFPERKLCSAHGGGSLPSCAVRSDYAALVFTPESLRHLAAKVGASQLMLDTDHS